MTASDICRVLRSRGKGEPKVGLVLGSGLNDFVDTIAEPMQIPYRDLDSFPMATAIGHRGELVLGSVGEASVAVMAGRFHLYEGYSAHQVTAGMRLFRDLGIERVVLTNAAGGIRPEFSEGALVAITDHINLQGTNPLVGPNDDTLGVRFPDMTDAYSPRLRQIALQTAKELGISLHEGVYAGLLGPSYETPAEIRFLRTIGADLVGMSTIAETIAAGHMSMEVLAISCVTNVAAGLSGKKLNHDEVLAAGQRVIERFRSLLAAVLPQLA